MWHLYGNVYDLQKFVESGDHPGGNDILEKTRNQKDVTALFESYHAFSNKIQIRKVLEKYKVGEDKNAPKQYDFQAYEELTELVKDMYPTRESIKCTNHQSWFLIKNLWIFLGLFYVTMITNYHWIIRSVCAFAAGGMYISLGFAGMHDASHYGLSVSPNINNIIDHAWNTCALWNRHIWFYHHVYNHHCFTKETNKDPDIYHFRPFAGKIENDKGVLKHFSRYQYWVLPFVVVIFPGMCMGQSLSYVIASTKHKLWKVELPSDVDLYSIYDVYFMVWMLILFYKAGWVSSVYMISLNFWYFINIFGDHDTFESSYTNHYTGNDWLKLQICNSGNFMNDNVLWTRYFGGINYQIEHHLYPNMCNIHYPKIAPIVRNYCKKHNIPYCHHETLWDTWLSFMKTIDKCSIKQE